MSFGDTTSKSKVELPKWLEQGGKDAAKSAINFYGKPFKSFEGDRVADFNDTQKNAFAAIGDWAGTPSSVTPAAIGIAKDSALAPAYQTTDFGRIVDENGPLGAMSDYISPYISEALNPAIKDIERAAATERMRIGDAASNANAYGDARHGVLEGTSDRNRIEAIGDTAYGAYADAWTQAMGAREADLNRMTQRDFQQGQFDETAANRGLSGAALMGELDTSNQANELQKLMTLLSSGNLQQQNTQSELDAAYEKWGLKQQDKYDKIAALVSVLSGVPYSRTTTTSQPDNSWASLGGAALGAFL